ncbi:Hypothetical protein MexAM1_META1p3813 [Methylorubrum extorquens AM1]|uniref:Uncharacterized protein n=2 Tax=Methylorubrum extorquens TaxID=408 RepID=C5AZY3_METEA|nr:Hypothetical protein MexAM1_META1p3813 [Methylorubrum extorquens AM1]
MKSSTNRWAASPWSRMRSQAQVASNRLRRVRTRKRCSSSWTKRCSKACLRSSNVVMAGLHFEAVAGLARVASGILATVGDKSVILPWGDWLIALAVSLPCRRCGSR